MENRLENPIRTCHRKRVLLVIDSIVVQRNHGDLLPRVWPALVARNRTISTTATIFLTFPGAAVGFSDVFVMERRWEVLWHHPFVHTHYTWGSVFLFLPFTFLNLLNKLSQEKAKERNFFISQTEGKKKETLETTPRKKQLFLSILSITFLGKQKEIKTENYKETYRSETRGVVRWKRRGFGGRRSHVFIFWFCYLLVSFIWVLQI